MERRKDPMNLYYKTGIHININNTFILTMIFNLNMRSTFKVELN